MTGRLLALLIVVCGLVAGVAIYYLQVYAFYRDVPQISLTATALDGHEVALATPGWKGIDADSSPIRFRGCFDAQITLEQAEATLAPYDGDPRNAPGWFSCFDAEEIGGMIDNGAAGVFLGTRNIHYGIDRVIAIAEDGRGFVWHDINDCGDKLYDGSPKGTDCPERE